MTGKQLNDDAWQIAKAEERKSVTFQRSLYANILGMPIQTATMFVSCTDITTTRNLLEKNKVASVPRKMDDKKLATLLGVDAIVRIQIRQNDI